MVFSYLILYVGSLTKCVAAIWDIRGCARNKKPKLYIWVWSLGIAAKAPGIDTDDSMMKYGNVATKTSVNSSLNSV